MLILTRKVGETVVIGDDIHCTILELRGKLVRLGFDAPRTLSVNRKEVHDRIQLERQGRLSIMDDTHPSIIDALIAKFKRQQSGPQVH